MEIISIVVRHLLEHYQFIARMAHIMASGFPIIYCVWGHMGPHGSIWFILCHVWTYGAMGGGNVTENVLP